MSGEAIDLLLVIYLYVVSRRWPDLGLGDTYDLGEWMSFTKFPTIYQRDMKYTKPHSC